MVIYVHHFTSHMACQRSSHMASQQSFRHRSSHRELAIEMQCSTAHDVCHYVSLHRDVPVHYATSTLVNVELTHAQVHTLQPLFFSTASAV